MSTESSHQREKEFFNGLTTRLPKTLGTMGVFG